MKTKMMILAAALPLLCGGVAAFAQQTTNPPGQRLMGGSGNYTTNGPGIGTNQAPPSANYPIQVLCYFGTNQPNGNVTATLGAYYNEFTFAGGATNFVGQWVNTGAGANNTNWIAVTNSATSFYAANGTWSGTQAFTNWGNTFNGNVVNAIVPQAFGAAVGTNDNTTGLALWVAAGNVSANSLMSLDGDWWQFSSALPAFTNLALDLEGYGGGLWTANTNICAIHLHGIANGVYPQHFTINNVGLYVAGTNIDGPNSIGIWIDESNGVYFTEQSIVENCQIGNFSQNIVAGVDSVSMELFHDYLGVCQTNMVYIGEGDGFEIDGCDLNLLSGPFNPNYSILPWEKSNVVAVVCADGLSLKMENNNGGGCKQDVVATDTRFNEEGDNWEADATANTNIALEYFNGCYSVHLNGVIMQNVQSETYAAEVGFTNCSMQNSRIENSPNVYRIFVSGNGGGGDNRTLPIIDENCIVTGYMPATNGYTVYPTGTLTRNDGSGDTVNGPETFAAAATFNSGFSSGGFTHIDRLQVGTLTPTNALPLAAFPAYVPTNGLLATNAQGVVDGAPLDLNSGLFLYLPFSAGTGTTAYDLSGNGNNGTFTTGNDWIAAPYGKFGGAYYFTNEAMYVSNLVSLPLTNFTFTFWAYTKAASASGEALILKDTTTGTNGTLSFQFFPDQSTYYYEAVFVTNSVAARFTLNTTLPYSWGDGAWHLFGIGYNGTNMFVYYDGNGQIGSLALTNALLYNTEVPFSVVEDSTSWHATDELKGWNRALSPNEFEQLYLAGVTTNTPTLPPAGKGFNGVITNWQPGILAYSNRLYYCNGVLTNETIP